jgi:hypothetical protein
VTWKVIRGVVLGADLVASKKVMNRLETAIGEGVYAATGMLGGVGFSRSPGAVSRPPTGKRGRPGLGARFYAEVARDYVRACEKNPSSPITELGRRRQIEPARARDFVRRARELGMLTAGRPGKPGGRVTEKAAALLQGRKGE